MGLKPGDHILDMGCGNGSYLKFFYTQLQGQGRFSGIDLWKEGLEELQDFADSHDPDAFSLFHRDFGEALPYGDGELDYVFLSTVFHDIHEDGSTEAVLAEIRRVLKASGILGIHEFRKLDGPPGPPRSIRLSPDDVDHLLVPAGFRRTGCAETGPYHYFCKYEKA